MNRRHFIQRMTLGSAGLAASFQAGALTAAADVDGFPPLASFEFETVTLDRLGRTRAVHRHVGRYLRMTLADDVAFDLIAVPGARFRMGAAAGELKCGAYECAPRIVRTAPHYLARTPVTQRQWQAVARLPRVARDLALSPACFVGDEHPVECVSWHDTQEFCARLSAHTGQAFRLPSEAEWEGACRAGSRDPFHFGATLTAAHANFSAAHTYAGERAGEYRRATLPVGQFAPNALGLQDMHGNVWEWCADHWHDDYRGAPRDQAAWVDHGNAAWRSLRGGSWADAPEKLRSASRSGYDADGLNRLIGFRVALSVSAA